MFRKFFLSETCGVLTAVLYRAVGQKVLATWPTNEEETDRHSFRSQNGKFSSKKTLKKSMSRQQNLIKARATQKQNFELPTNFVCTTTRSHDKVSATFIQLYKFDYSIIEI